MSYQAACVSPNLLTTVPAEPGLASWQVKKLQVSHVFRLLSYNIGYIVHEQRNWKLESD